MLTFYACHNETDVGFDRIEWPTAGSFVEQEQLVVSMFCLIQNEFEKTKQRKYKSEQSKLNARKKGIL